MVSMLIESPSWTICGQSVSVYVHVRMYVYTYWIISLGFWDFVAYVASRESENIASS